jgi:hypothetical protein
MFILTKNRLEKSQIPELENMLVAKRNINLKDALVLNNPNHINYMSSFNINNFNFIYEVDDYTLIENNNLFNHIKDKDKETIIKTLSSTHEDNLCVKELVALILKESNFDPKFLRDAENMLNKLMSIIYLENKTMPKVAINKLKDKLSQKGDKMTKMDFLELKLLKKRTTRWTLIKTSRIISHLNKQITSAYVFYDINKSLSDRQNFIYLTDKEYSTIYEPNKAGKKIIEQNDLYTSYRYRDLKELKDASSVNYKKLKYIYVGCNSYVLKQLSYLDFLRCPESVVALTNMFKGFTIENIDLNMFNEEFLEEVIAGNYEDLIDVIATKFKELVPEDLKELFVKKEVKKEPKAKKVKVVEPVEIPNDDLVIDIIKESSDTGSKDEALSFVSDMFNM